MWIEFDLKQNGVRYQAIVNSEHIQKIGFNEENQEFYLTMNGEIACGWHGEDALGIYEAFLSALMGVEEHLNLIGYVRPFFEEDKYYDVMNEVS